MSELEFIAGMNISPLTVEELRNIGWEIVRVSEIMDARTKDIEILTYAKENNKVLISHDLDFSMLLAVGGHQKPSVINLRLNNAKPDFITKRIIEILHEMKNELIEGVVVSVDETSARFRNLPISSV